MASAKGEPKQAPSPSAKAKPKAKPKSVAGGMGKPKQAKAKNAKQKPSRPKKQSLRKRNEELRAELLRLYSDAVLVAYERTALGTATDADERENIIRVAEEAATTRTTSERMYREKAENDRDTVLAEAEAVMKKEVQRRDEEDERRSAAEAEMRRAAEEEIRMRLAEDKRRGEAQAAERKLAADGRRRLGVGRFLNDRCARATRRETWHGGCHTVATIAATRRDARYDTLRRERAIT